MTTRPKIHRPAFLWQAVLILLPVIILAAVSAVSLRLDERTAEADARKNAADNVQSLARSMRLSVADELQRYLVLQNTWVMGLHSASQPCVSGFKFPDTKLQAETEKWERDYPGLKLAEVAMAQGLILDDGRQIEPPEISDAPVPPPWFQQLSPAQKETWEAMRAAGSHQELVTAWRTFTDGNPSTIARQAAFELVSSPEQVAANSGALPSESGISFEEIACYQLLTATNASPTEPLFQSLWWRAFNHPSFLTPRLLAAAGALTNRAYAVLPEKLEQMGQLWNAHSRARECLLPLRQIRGLTSAPEQSKFYVSWAGEALAFLEPCTFTNMGGDMNDIGLNGLGHNVWLFPRLVVEAVFDRALTENKTFIPNYAGVAVTVEGVPFVSAWHHELIKRKTPADTDQPAMPMASVTTPDHWQLLGTATQAAGPRMNPDAAGFTVNIYLTDRDEMLAAVRHHQQIFIVVILSAVFASLAGLAAAWRAFHRQLQLNELKSNFVSSVSHELRAPIASVRLMAENLERGKIPDPARQGEYFHFIVQECRRLSSLIENVLDFSRIEQGRKQYDFEPTNLAALTETTVKLMEPYAAEKGVNLKLETSSSAAENGNLEMDIDGRAIQQALVNLIDNAVKHSPKGEKVTIEIKRAADPINHQLSTINLSVTDHGPGIPVAEREKIFERFYRLGSELRRETQGVGIGLSVVKHIVEAHSGRVIVKSEVGKGSRFTIELPVENRTQ